MCNAKVANESEARELAVYIENDGTFYRNKTTSAIANLKKKHKAGLYDKEKAIVLWTHVATAGAAAYRKEYGSCDGGFTPATRRLCASMLEATYLENVTE